jgi:branched-chain amino acid transport system substrate-binding protein
MTRSWRPRTAVPLIATLAILVAACGSSGGGASSTAAPTTQAPATSAAPASSAPATQAPTTGAATTVAGTAAPAAFQVPTTNCPADATQPLADGAPLKIGFIGPFTGPLAGFGIIAKGLNTYFNKINSTEGGIAGHKLVLVTKDDAYDPAKSKPAVEEAIQGDKIFASVIQVGTPNVGGTRSDYEAACVPQAWVGTGFPAWGDPAHHPWTVGGIMAYPTEALIWSEFLKEKKPGAKVAELVYNNDFGKSYQKAFEAAAPANGFKVVAAVTHEATSDLTNEVTQILAANPDVILGETTATFCTNLMKLARQGGFSGPIILSSTCQSVQQFVAPAGDAAKDAYTIVYTKDPSDATYANDPAVKAYLADVAKYGNGADGKIGSTATGYTIGYLIAENLKRAAQLQGGLTRANLMDAIWSTDTSTPLAIGGKAHVNGTTDAYVAEYGKIVVYDPAAGGYKDTGFSVDLEGKTGVVKG